MYSDICNGFDHGSKRKLDEFIALHPELTDAFGSELELPRDDYEEFLRGLDPSIPFEGFVDHCRLYSFLGRRLDGATLPVFLYRVVNRASFARRLRRVMMMAMADDIDFLRWFVTLPESDRRKGLGAMPLGREGAPVFACFSRSSLNDPVAELDKNSTHLRNVLGLDERGYLIMLKYPCGSISMPSIPTVADAAGYKFFRPAPPGSLTGWTLNLVVKQQVLTGDGEAADALKSLPEVVHKNANGDILEGATFIMLPEAAGPLP